MDSKDKTAGLEPGVTLRNLDRPTMVGSERRPEPRPLQLWLKLRDRDIALRPGRLLVGRSAECHVVVDDALVSRRHAAFDVAVDRVVVADLGSVNGVFVNGMRIASPKELRPGDRVVIGKQEMTILSSPPSQPAGAARRTAQTNPRSETLAKLQTADQTPLVRDLDGEPLEEQSSESTHKGDALELLGGVAEKVLALGRGAEAERILSSYFQNTLRATRATRTVDGATADRVAKYAVKLAAATGKGSWIDFIVEIFTIARRPWPAEVVDDLYTVLRKVSAVDVPALRGYVAALQAAQGRFGPAERFVVQRIEGLERLAGLK